MAKKKTAAKATPSKKTKPVTAKKAPAKTAAARKVTARSAPKKAAPKKGKRKVALITGITGQDGAYLSELLLNKGYEVHGVKRRSSLLNTDRIDHLYHDKHEKGLPFFLHYGDLTDSVNCVRLVQQIQPDEIYNLAAMSHVAVSFELPEYTANADGIGTLRFLEAIRILGLEKKTRFYQASTSELYGGVIHSAQNEETPFYPRSPYGVAKLYGFWITKNYRESYGIFACNGILFNHESPLRGETFVTRKITRAGRRRGGRAAALPGWRGPRALGNLPAVRDACHQHRRLVRPGAVGRPGAAPDPARLAARPGHRADGRLHDVQHRQRGDRPAADRPPLRRRRDHRPRHARRRPAGGLGGVLARRPRRLTAGELRAPNRVVRRCQRTQTVRPSPTG